MITRSENYRQILVAHAKLLTNLTAACNAARSLEVYATKEGVAFSRERFGQFFKRFREGIESLLLDMAERRNRLEG